MSKGNDKENISIFYLLNNFKYTIICTAFFVFIIIIKIFEIGKRKNDASSKISASKNDSIFQTRNLRKKEIKRKKIKILNTKIIYRIFKTRFLLKKIKLKKLEKSKSL